MKIFSKTNVYDKALERIRFLFDEFPVVIVGFSGGKDSTVTLNLALQVAREKGRLPLPVMWIDQEAEWQGTVDICTEVMTHPDVKPYWYQMPMVITNNASVFNRFNYCWDAAEQANWIHPQHPLSIKENTFGTDRFHELFERILRVEFPHQKACYLAGVRAEEAPKRFVTLTQDLTYQWITWGKQLSENQYTFYPLYDWHYSDVWKAIHDHDWHYNRVYDSYYQMGIAPKVMRISNVHHETSVQSLQLMQEIEPATWERIVQRIPGANTVNQMDKSAFACPTELPFMFTDWEEYALYLIEHIVQEQKNKDLILKEIARYAKLYIHTAVKTELYKVVVNSVLSSDWDLTKLKNFEMNPHVYDYRKWRKHKHNSIEDIKHGLANPLMPAEGKAEFIRRYDALNTD